MKLWSDDDALWEAMTPALAADVRFAIAAKDVDAIVRSLSLAPPARVLDVGCGAGAHAIAFAQRGFEVVGVDRTVSLLALVRTRSTNLSLVCEDMRTLSFPPAFDLVCCLYSSFGYFGEEINLRVLRSMRDSLRPGGTLVLDVIAGWEESASMEIAGMHFMVRRKLSGARLIEEWTVGGRRFRTEQRIYAAAELDELLRAAGFVRVRLAGGFDTTIPGDASAARLVAFATASS